ncbi:MAG: hypothetical protein ACLFUG_11525, partial [Nitriliruptoraceae bacterium]
MKKSDYIPPVYITSIFSRLRIQTAFHFRLLLLLTVATESAAGAEAILSEDSPWALYLVWSPDRY